MADHNHIRQFYWDRSLERKLEKKLLTAVPWCFPELKKNKHIAIGTLFRLIVLVQKGRGSSNGLSLWSSAFFCKIDSRFRLSMSTVSTFRKVFDIINLDSIPCTGILIGQKAKICPFLSIFRITLIYQVDFCHQHLIRVFPIREREFSSKVPGLIVVLKSWLMEQAKNWF